MGYFEGKFLYLDWHICPCIMFCRSISWFICFSIAFVIANGYNDTDFIIGSHPEVTVHHLRTDNPDSSTMEAIQEVKETTAVDLSTLLDASDGAIVTLVAGETRLAAHRAVLIARSPVFAAKFSRASSSEVSVADVEGPVLRQLLAYMYTLQAPPLSSMAPQLLVAADRYGLSSLKAACEQQVAAQLAVENAAAMAVLALRHSCPTLRRAAVAFIKDHTHQVVMTQSWVDAVVHHPHYAVELSRLIAEPPAETSTPAAAEGGLTGSAQPRCGRARIPATTALPAASCRTPPPGDATVSHLRGLSEDEKGRRLIEAAVDGTVEELQALLAAGADVAARDGDRRTALHWAADRGQVEAVRCLLEAGAEVDARNRVESTPLLWAASSGRTAVVQLLVSSCADPNASNFWGTTPLHYAAESGHTEAATALLEAGANRCARDGNGDTPSDFARRENHQQLVELLTRSSQPCL